MATCNTYQLWSELQAWEKKLAALNANNTGASNTDASNTDMQATLMQATLMPRNTDASNIDDI